jgi:transcriptional regulator with XRE-family HTH domain
MADTVRTSLDQLRPDKEEGGLTMPGTSGDESVAPRTLAEKLTALREGLASEGGKPPSWNTLAREISEQTGVPISGPYLWELATGKPGTNVTLRHLKALSDYFHRRISYFVDDEVAFEDDTQAQLDLLRELRRLGVRNIRLQNAGPGTADRETVQALLARLQTLDVLGDEGVREVALGASALSPEQRKILSDLAAQPGLLGALPRVMGILEAAQQLTEEHLTAAANILRQPDLLLATADESVREIAMKCHELLPSSRQALLPVIAQLQHLEGDKS